jgi:hypothetical protein
MQPKEFDRRAGNDAGTCADAFRTSVFNHLTGRDARPSTRDMSRPSPTRPSFLIHDVQCPTRNSGLASGCLHGSANPEISLHCFCNNRDKTARFGNFEKWKSERCGI